MYDLLGILVKKYPGITPSQFLDMTFPEICLYLERRTEISPAEAMEILEARARKTPQDWLDSAL